jgi:hypothetical protein
MHINALKPCPVRVCVLADRCPYGQQGPLPVRRAGLSHPGGQYTPPPARVLPQTRGSHGPAAPTYRCISTFRGVSPDRVSNGAMTLGRRCEYITSSPSTSSNCAGTQHQLVAALPQQFRPQPLVLTGTYHARLRALHCGVLRGRGWGRRLGRAGRILRDRLRPCSKASCNSQARCKMFQRRTQLLIKHTRAASPNNMHSRRRTLGLRDNALCPQNCYARHGSLLRPIKSGPEQVF